MRKSTGMFLKQGLAALLSLSMIAGPCSPGIVPAFAAQIGSEEAAAAADVEKNATASDAERKSETSEASPSDALFDEDGFLLDGEVKDDAAGKTEAGEIEGGKNAEEETAGGKNAAGDVSREIVAAKTEKIAAAEALAEDGWYSDYEYDLDDDAQTITLTKYIGDENDVYVPAETEIDGTVYATVVENQRGYDDSVWAERQDTLTSIAFEEGVRLTGTAEDMFSEFTALKSVDLSGVDASEITETSGMFRLCEALEEVDLSRINIGNVEEMMQMFQGCASLEELDLSSLDTKNVTYMSEMFQECTSLKRMVLSGLDTGNLLGMDAMFKDCAALEYVDMSGIDTSNIELMMNVFENCTSLRTVDMTGVDMAGISDAVWGEGMLANCTSLETFYAPVNVAAEIGLPVTLYDEAGTAWTSLPQGLTESVRLSKTVKVSYVKINSTAKSIALGKTFQLRAWPQPVNAENKAVTWESSNPSVAAVDSTGLVTAVKAGTADVTVTTEDGGFTAVCKITVTVPVTGVKINVTSGEKTIEAGKTFQMAAWPQPSNATNKAVTWSSSNTAVAKVSSSGLVTAAAAGTAVVTVTTADGGFTETCKITVVVPVTSVKINSTAKTLEVGKTFQLAAWPQPTNATNKTVTWTSSNSAVAKVSSKGLVTAVKAGSAVITVKTADGGKTAACKITVQAASPATVPVTSVKINSTAKTLEVGKTFQLAAWPQPTNATNKAVTWYSFNTSVATVSSTGLVTAKGKGSTNVRVMTKDGGKIAYCKITVQEASPATVPVTSVKINSTAKTLAPGATFQLAAWPQPANATNKAVTWYSFNTSVATVSSNGLVTAKGTGSTNIRVMTKDGGKIAYCKITVEKPVIPAGYSVSAPTNVHWTDGFKLAWDYGRTQDGSVYQKWAYKMYNAETGAKIGSHSKKDTDGTSIEYFIKTGTIEKMTTGSYYFTVCALDADNNQISPEVRSELKAFTHPNAWAPKPYNLRWSGTKLLFEIPDSAKSKINRMSYDIYYSETENGTYSDKGMPHVMTNIDFSRDFQSRFTKPGYYKFTLKVFNSDPRIIMPGEEAWSPVIHITE